jgi:ATP-dependent Lon protease
MLPEPIPLFFIKKKVVFPHARIKVSVPRTSNTEELSQGMDITAAPMSSLLNLCPMTEKRGTLCEILSIDRKDNVIRMELKGKSRVIMETISGFRQASVSLLREEEEDGETSDILRKKAQELIFLIDVQESDRLISLLPLMNEPGQLSDFVGHYFITDFRKRAKLLKEESPDKRNRYLLKEITRLIMKMRIKRNSPDKSPIVREAEYLIEKLNRKDNLS